MGVTPICTISSSGIFRPDLATCLAYFTGAYQGIYGSDVYLGSDSQDGELMGLLAAALDDVNQEAVGAYNGYSPATAQGVNLSSVVKINGIKRAVSSASTVPVIVVGPQGTPIVNGLAADEAGYQWALPALTLIPVAGQITVTATCTVQGAINLAAGQALTAVNPTRGWQSTTTSAAATPGAPVEMDGQLRLRQSNSTTLPSRTMLESISAALWQIPGVEGLRIYQNDGDTLDANGLPGHSIAVVIDGGDAQTIAATIAAQKFACGTFGTTTETVVDTLGVSHPINFFFVSRPEINWSVTIHPGPNYSVATGVLIGNALAAYTNGLGIGVPIQLTRAYQAAYLSPLISKAAADLQAAVAANDTVTIGTVALNLQSLNAASSTYEVTALSIGRAGGALAPADLAIAFSEEASIPVNGDGTLVNLLDVVVVIL